MRREPDDIADAGPTPETYLAELGAAGDGPHDIAVAALMLAALDHRETDLKPFRAHLAELGQTARDAAGFVPDPESAAKALAQVLCGRYGYDGDRMQYDDPLNADMIAVIERRRGLPVALGILYMHAARAAGMEAFGLFAPGHFLLKLALKGGEIVIDPFNGVPFEREALAGPFGAPQFEGSDVADESGPFAPVSDTEVLLRLLSNLKSRALNARDHGRGIEILQRMTLIGPRRQGLWLELGKLYEGAGTLSLSRAAYENCLASTPARGGALRNEAMLALTALKRRLN